MHHEVTCISTVPTIRSPHISCPRSAAGGHAYSRRDDRHQSARTGTDALRRLRDNARDSNGGVSMVHRFRPRAEPVVVGGV